MEFRDLLLLLGRSWRTVVVMSGIAIILTLSYAIMRGPRWETSLLLTVTRSGTQTTQDYRYDDFYRLQADERFSDTVVRLLAEPRIVTDIYTAAQIRPPATRRALAGAFAATRRSSQVVSVRFTSTSESDAQRIAAALVEVLQDQNDLFNARQKQDNWFTIIAAAPVVLKSGPTLLTLIILSVAVGAFIAVWIILLRSYMRSDGGARHASSSYAHRH